MIRESINERTPGWVRVGYGTIYLNTKRGQSLIDSITTPCRMWQSWHNLGVALVLLSMVLTVLALMWAAALTALDPTPSAVNEPTNMVAVPGLNEFLPLEVWPYIIGMLLAALAVHELAHAVSMRVENIELAELGVVCIGPLPIGAYALPTDEFDGAPVMSRVRTFAAGPMVNLALFAITLGSAAVTDANLAGAYNAYMGSVIGATIPGVSETIDIWTELTYWSLFANVNLVLMNVLPIPGLDGGQIVRDLSRERLTTTQMRLTTGVFGGIALVSVLTVLFLPHVVGWFA